MEASGDQSFEQQEGQIQQKIIKKNKWNYIEDLLSKIPQDIQVDVVKELFKSLEGEQKKQVAASVVKESSQDVKVDIVKEAASDLSNKERKELANTLLPDHRVINQVWLTVIRSLSLAVVISVICLALSIFLTTNQNTQMLLTVFTTIIAFFGGLLTPKPATD